MFVLLCQVHERVNDAHYDYDLLHFIDVYMYFFSWWARCLFSIGVVYVVSNKAPSFPLSCLGVLFKHIFYEYIFLNKKYPRGSVHFRPHH